MAKKQYRIRNWKHYNNSLINRGSITLWFDKESIDKWYDNTINTSKGRPKCYSDIAIECALTIKAVYNLTYRTTQGFLSSIIKIMGLNIKVPHYTVLCRRAKDLNISLPNNSSDSPIDIVFDSTGLKIFGEGEWKVRQHGYNKRRTWRKLHLALNPVTNNIESSALTTNDFKDSEILPDLLDDIVSPLDKCCGDGGYDSHETYKYIKSLGGKPIIPPRKDAVIAKHGNSKGPTLPRDDVVRSIKKLGIKKWKKKSGYHSRSLSETAMFRFKKIFGDTLSSRNFDSQGVEAFIKCKSLNKMASLGMPDSYPIN